MEPMKTRSFAFSLFELLIVMAIISFLLVMVVPATSSLVQSTNIARGGQLVESQLQLARQIASSKNRSIEVRFIKTSELTDGGFGAIQLWQLDSPKAGATNVLSPVTRIETLPTGICISENATLASRFLALAPSGTMPSGNALSGKAFASLRIHPSGLVSPAMDMNRLYLSVVPARDGNAAALPKNFVTIQLNPLTGTPLIYRP
jgi:uncharacterized protein (TIGR02596 family)